MVNTKEIEAQMQRKGITQAMLAQRLGMNPALLYKKINNANGEVLTVREACEMVMVLEFPGNRAAEIFFA